MKKNTPLLRLYRHYFRAYPQLFDRFQTQKFILYVYIFLTLFTVSFFGVFVIRPTLITISDLNRESDDNVLVIRKLDQKLEALSSLESQYQTIQSELVYLDSAVPVSPQIPVLTRKLEMMALEHELLIDRLDFGTIEIYPNIKAESPFFSFRFTLSVRGNESDINAFLSDLIDFDRVVLIDRVTSEGGGSEAIGLIVGNAFFYSSSL